MIFIAAINPSLLSDLKVNLRAAEPLGPSLYIAIFNLGEQDVGRGDSQPYRECVNEFGDIISAAEIPCSVTLGDIHGR